MTTGIDPYVVPVAIDEDPTPGIFVTTITTEEEMVDIGGVEANAETYNGNIPGPTFFLNVGDTVIVRLVNKLSHPTGIHWHGIELANSADGTQVTQNGVVPRFAAAPPSPAPAGGTYLYKFKVTRPGLFWYHPHHHHSTNRVFKGLYGMIVVADPNETSLIASSVIPNGADTKQIVLSDITVCKSPGSNDQMTYDLTMPWVGGANLPAQPGPTPVELCEIPPSGTAKTDNGDDATASYNLNDIPSIVRPNRTNEGQIVLTNGVNVGGRDGSPSVPGPLNIGAQTLDILAGQGLRLQIVNCAAVRYFRLILTDSTGAQIPLVRIGGEGGLLDNAIIEGGVVNDPGGTGDFDTKYTNGEILIPPASRADIVAVIPNNATGVLTMWTQDFQRVGAGTQFSNIPTVPVMHLNVTGTAPLTYTISAGTALRESIPGQAVETLGTPTGTLLTPANFIPPKPGMSNQNIQITTPPSFDGVPGTFGGFTPYTDAPHIASSRFVEQGHILELTITNTTNAHHPFHLHGFSFQPISLTQLGAATFTWPYREFRDNLDVPNNYSLPFRVRLDDRPLLDGTTLGGALGRWLFHCHIFFHHHQGMISELVVTTPNGREKPNIDIGGSWAYAPSGGIASRNGTYNHPDGLPVTLNASIGTVIDTGGGTWSWSSPAALPDQVTYVYITGTDPDGRKDQAVFRLKIGAPDDGADNGDPHIYTVDGKRYDFQAVGEFILLQDDEGMEIQVRQTPVEVANPITDPYSGLRSCVSVNTAVSARVGNHSISYQPGRERNVLQLYVDGKPANTSEGGFDLDEHRITIYEVSGGGKAVCIDYAHYPVLTITPYFWNRYKIWLLNVDIAHTQGNDGLMGSIPINSWLPRLRNGNIVGPMPSSLHNRYIQLYHTFADSWRVTDSSSLFIYAEGTSTKTFTDRNWPPEKPPCKLSQQFEVPGGTPVLNGMKIDEAKEVCGLIKIDNLQKDCVFDVATTGDKVFALGYKLSQDLKQCGTAIQITTDKIRTKPGEPFVVNVIVSSLHKNNVYPHGKVILFIDNSKTDQLSEIKEGGRASFKVTDLKAGKHLIRVFYIGQDNKDNCYYPSSSPNIIHFVENDNYNKNIKND